MGKVSRKRSKASSKALAWVERRENIVALIALIAVITSILSLLGSVVTYISNQKANPLAYRIAPSIMSHTSTGGKNTIVVKLRIVVSDGAIGDIRFFNYVDGIIDADRDYTSGEVTEFSSKLKPAFSFTLETTSEDNYITQYVIAKGKDGSSNFGMIIYTITESGVSTKYWTSLDVALAEISESYNVYNVAISNYRILANLLKERGDL